MSSPKIRIPIRKPQPWLTPTQKYIIKSLASTAVLGAILGAHHFTVYGNSHRFPLTTLEGMAKGALVGATWPLWIPFAVFK
jgi:hypothetical protein